MTNINAEILIGELLDVKCDRNERNYKNENINSYNRGYANGIAEAIKIVEEMPNAERKAYWLKNDKYINAEQCTVISIECSRCGFATIHNINHVTYRFCPNCGARMEGTQ